MTPLIYKAFYRHRVSRRHSEITEKTAPSGRRKLFVNICAIYGVYYAKLFVNFFSARVCARVAGYVKLASRVSRCESDTRGPRKRKRRGQPAPLLLQMRGFFQPTTGSNSASASVATNPLPSTKTRRGSDPSGIALAMQYARAPPWLHLSCVLRQFLPVG